MGRYIRAGSLVEDAGFHVPDMKVIGAAMEGISKPYTGSPFCPANSFSDTCGLAPICWITSAAASAPSRPAAS